MIFYDTGIFALSYGARSTYLEYKARADGRCVTSKELDIQWRQTEEGLEVRAVSEGIGRGGAARFVWEEVGSHTQFWAKTQENRPFDVH